MRIAESYNLPRARSSVMVLKLLTSALAPLSSEVLPSETIQAMCAAKDSPWGQSKSYLREWMHHSIFCVREAWRMASSLYAMLR